MKQRWPTDQRNKRQRMRNNLLKMATTKISTETMKNKNGNFFFSILLTVKIHSKSCKFWRKFRTNANEINFIENFENFFNKIFGRNISLFDEKKIYI